MKKEKIFEIGIRALMFLLLIGAAANADTSREKMLGDATALRRLNQELKAAVKKKTSDVKVRREAVQKFYSQTFADELKDWKRELSKGNDGRLMTQFLSTVASLENSADEALCEILAQVFRANPELFEKNFAALSSEQRSVVSDRLDFGWANLVYGKKMDGAERALEKRLKRMATMGGEKK